MKPWHQIISIADNLMGTMGIAWKDFSTGEEFYYNSDDLFPAASIIKLHILAEVLRQADKGELSLSEEICITDSDKVGGAGVLQSMHGGLKLPIVDLAALMIVVSDNTASNLLIERAGIDRINALIQELQLAGTTFGRTFMTHPHLPPANFITAKDTLILLKLLYSGKLLSQDNTRLALDILSKQQFKDKLPKKLPPDICCAHKTGEINGVRHDAGIVLLPDRAYGLVMLTKELAEEEAGDMAISEVSRLIYQYVTHEENGK